MIAGSNKELKLLNKAASDFAKKELAPSREENDKYPYGPFFGTILDKAYEIDFLHILLSEKAGGMGQGLSALSVVLDNICQEDASLGGIMFTTAAAHELITIAGNDDKLAQITETAKKVQDFLIAFPVFNNPSEVPHVASAAKKGESYTLSGSVEYMVAGNISGHALVPATLPGTDGYTYFLVDLGKDTVSASAPVLSLGLHACPAVDMTFNNAEGMLVGEAGKGADYFKAMSDRLHVAAAAMSLGIMKGSLKEGLTYAKGRFQGGREIIHWSEMKMILADMGVKIKNGEMILKTAVNAVDAKENGWQACSRAAAIHIQSMACDVTTDGIQVLGGVGYMKDFGQEKRFRDAKHIQSLLGMAPLKKINYFEDYIA